MVVGDFIKRAHARGAEPRPLTDVEIRLLRLSPRETEVLGLIAGGLSNEQIADHLYLSINSIKTHARNLFRKLGVGGRTQAAVWLWSRPESWWETPPADAEATGPTGGL